MVAFTDGDWSRCNAIADRGFTAAQRAGISSAFSARAAQTFAQHWICGTHGELLPLLQGAPPDAQRTLLAESAIAVALATKPDRADQAALMVEQLCARATAFESPFAPAIAALLASAGIHDASGHVSRTLRGLIEPYSGTCLVIGTGVANLGPATRALSMLATSSDEQVELLSAAVREADQWNLRAWSVRCRLDLFDLTGEDALRTDARRSAAGTDLFEYLFAPWDAVLSQADPTEEYRH